MIKDDNYIKVYGFMINNLNLKSNELLAYALIYALAKDDYKPISVNYFMNWLNVSKPAVIKILNNLEIKKLILVKKSNNKANLYKTNLNELKNFTRQDFTSKETLPRELRNFTPTSKESLPPRGKETLPINKNINKYKNNILNNRESVREKAPTLEDIQNDILKNAYVVDANKFYTFYTAKNWQGVKDWRAMLKYWHLKDLENNPELKNLNNQEESKKDSSDEPKQDIDFNALLDKLI